MRPLLSALGLLAVLTAAASAQATPLVLDAANATAPAGPPGLGACAIARKGAPDQWLSSIAQASLLLDSPEDAAPEVRFPLTLTDVSNGTAQSAGDFAVDDPLPWSGGGSPSGDGELVAMRWTGLFRVESPTTLTLAVRSDDGFSLRLGGTIVFSHLGVRTSHVDTRVVTFVDAGRYPFELIYFENLTDAVLEWSYVEGEAPEVASTLELPAEGFALVPVTMLVAPSNDPSSCGSSCARCGAEAPYCAGGLCVKTPLSPPAGEDGAGGAGGAGGADGAEAPPSTTDASSSGVGGAGGALDGSGGLPNEVRTAGEEAASGSLLLGSGRCSVSPTSERSSGPAWLLGAALAWVTRRRGRHA